MVSARRLVYTAILCALALTSAIIRAQSTATPTPAAIESGQDPAGPTFDVVSVKRNTSDSGSMSTSQRPGGGYVMVGGTIRMLITSAYPTPGSSEVIGLPAWAASERYDVTATAALPGSPSADQRRQMMRAMLADRLKLKAHIESREVPAFALVLGRGDGKLGPQLKPAEVDCAARAAALRVTADAARAGGGFGPAPTPFVPPAPGSPVPPCSMRMTGNRMEGDVTMASLASMLRPMTGRFTIDKTGLVGYYKMVLEADRGPLSGGAGPDVAATTPGSAPSIFTALQEQLGLKLESTRAQVEVLVIDHIERPSEN